MLLRHTNNNQENQNYTHNTTDYPLLPSSQRPLTNNNLVMNKLDEVPNGMAKLHESFESIARKQYEFEQHPTILECTYTTIKFYSSRAYVYNGKKLVYFNIFISVDFRDSILI
ncbi:unnamed protein product [Rotaria magnacalcarata]|uniref:Uncharacterized protein n=1 Tax=Rotaria magnacalcarata TaxID=392030 RepID=A0A816T448_9BILA|nr:unnamed protein product [Rotaria magnacalcarata]